MCPPGMTAECLGAAEVALRQIEEEAVKGSTGTLEAAMAGLRPSEELAQQVRAEFGPLLRRSSEWDRREVAWHLPATSAVGRRLHRAARALLKLPRTGLQRPTGNRCPKEPLTVMGVGGMINFGLSGGADVQGKTLLRERWADIGSLMSGLGANWFFGISCRCPAAEDPATAVPGFPFKMFGPRVPEYGAVTLFTRGDRTDAVLHMPSWSSSGATCWAQVGPASYWGGFSVPPRKRGTNEEIRKALLHTIFAEYDRAAAVAKKNGGKAYLAGDLNPSMDTELLVRRLLATRDMVESIPQEVATHVAGRRLDVVWGPRRAGAPMVRVHDGEHCRRRGCQEHACGRRHEVFDSEDLDRHPVTWPDPSDGVDRKTASHELQFQGDVLAWHEALCECSGDLFRVLHMEIESRLPCELWRSASKDSGERALAAAAWVWRLGLSMTGLAAGLGRVVRRKGGEEQTGGASHMEVRALRDIAAAVRRREAEPGCPDAAAAVSEARGALRAVRAEARRRAEGRVQEDIRRLVANNPQAVGKALRRLTSSAAPGLPAIMNDPECPAQLVGPAAVLEGAARYILRRDWPPWADEWDQEHHGELTRAVDTIRTEAIADLQRWAVTDAYTLEEMEAGLRQIRVGSHCRGLPYASVLCGHPAMTQALLCMMSLALRLGTAADLWLEQDNYHSAKEGRNRQDYEGYRVLALSSAEGRVLEELWSQRHLAALREALPAEQESGGECLVSGLVDFECQAICAAQGRPFMELFADEAEAFDSQDRREALVAVSDRAGVGGKARLQLEAMLGRTTVTVVAHGQRSRRFRPKVGMPEGRKLSPILYCVGSAAKLQTAADNSTTGVGLDPCPCALRAYLESRDGTDAPVLDTDEVEQWQILQQAGESWATIMNGASSDAVRLALLDSTATVRVGLRAFVDDIRCPVSSRGQCGLVATALQSAARRHRARLRYGPTKTAALASGAMDTRPCGSVEFVSQYTCLGVVRDTRAPGRAHLQSCLAAARRLGLQHVRVMQDWRFPFGLQMQLLWMCTRSEALFGLELCIHLPDFDKAVNRAQEEWGRWLLGLTGPVARVRILEALGWQERWSTHYRGLACMLWARIQVDPRYAKAREVLQESEPVQGSWAATMAGLLRRLGVRKPGAAQSRTKASRRRLLLGFRSRVRRRLHEQVEQPWLTARPQARARAASGRTWGAHHLATAGCTTEEVQAWARLALQGAFVSDRAGVVPPCRLCGGAPETAVHLLKHCPSLAEDPLSADLILGEPPVEAAPQAAAAAARLQRRCEAGAP